MNDCSNSPYLYRRRSFIKGSQMVNPASEIHMGKWREMCVTVQNNIMRAMVIEGEQKYKFTRRLAAIAHAYNIVVVVTNHVNTTPMYPKDSEEISVDSNQFLYNATMSSMEF